MANLTKIEGIEPTFVEKLKKTGITTTEALLERGSSPKGRQEICKVTRSAYTTMQSTLTSMTTLFTTARLFCR